MNKKIFVLLLTGFLYLQCCQATPAAKLETKSSDESKENSITAPVKERVANSDSDEDVIIEDISGKNMLLLFALSELTDLANFTLIKGKVIFNNVLNDETVKKETNEVLKAHLQNFTNFLDRVAEVEKLTDFEFKTPKLFNLTVEFGELVSRYEKQTEIAEENIITAALERGGVKVLDKDFEKYFADFEKRFDKEYDIFIKSLTDKQKLEESKMIEWYDKFHQANGYEIKLDNFAKFFDLYE